MGVRIVTDAVASISPADRERLAIATVAIHVYNGSQPLSEDELSDTGFYARLDDMDGLPTTSQPSPAEFAVVFRELLAKGHDVLAVLISGGLSGTAASALLSMMLRIVPILTAEKAQRFAAEVVEPVVGRKLPIVPIHAVVGIHVGPAVGVAYETEEPLR